MGSRSSSNVSSITYMDWNLTTLCQLRRPEASSPTIELLGPDVAGCSARAASREKGSASM